MASIKDVASLAGCGISTVSRVINGNVIVSPEVKKRVLSAIKQLNYEPNHSAQSLKTRKSKIVGLFIPVLSNPFFSVFAEKLESYLDEKGFKILLVCSQSDKNKELRFLKMLAQNRVDGAIMITHHDIGAYNPSMPVVTLDRHMENIPCITSDNYASTFNALNYLWERGARNIAYLGGKPSISSEVENRHKAYDDFVAEKGIENLSIYEAINHGDEHLFAQKFFETYGEKADAVFCSTDMLGCSVLEYAGKYGKSVPENLKIISYDGVLRKFGIQPDMTCIMQDVDGMAKCIVQELINRIEGKTLSDKVVVPTIFHIGKTT